MPFRSTKTLFSALLLFVSAVDCVGNVRRNRDHRRAGGILHGRPQQGAMTPAAVPAERQNIGHLIPQVGVQPITGNNSPEAGNYGSYQPQNWQQEQNQERPYAHILPRGYVAIDQFDGPWRRHWSGNYSPSRGLLGDFKFLQC